MTTGRFVTESEASSFGEDNQESLGVTLFGLIHMPARSSKKAVEVSN